MNTDQVPAIVSVQYTYRARTWQLDVWKAPFTAARVVIVNTIGKCLFSALCF